MPRTPPELPTPFPELREPDGFTIHLRTITPMFGGSAETRQVNEQNPIRAASVRGHLRFWWRATAGGDYKTEKELFEAESAIWGSTEKPGQVRVEVVCDTSKQQRIYPSDLNKGGGSPAQTGPREAFFIHPFQANQSKNEPEEFGITDVQFTVKMNLDKCLKPSQRQEVKTAIRAWIAFGGIGARTRRGCGALTVTEAVSEWLPVNPQQLWEWFGEEPSKERPKYTVITGAKIFLSDPSTRDVIKGVWRDLGRFWTRFRKGHFTERRPEYSPMSGGAWHDHFALKEGIVRGESARLAKPFLGLPIIYQKFPKTQAFAGSLEAVGEGKKRMASPIILKPCAFEDGIRGLILILNSPHPRQISISGQVHDLTVPEYDPVLHALKVRGPLAAVGAAARQSGYNTEVSL